MPSIRPASPRLIRAISALLLLTLAGSASAGLRDEDAATAAGQSIVEALADGRMEEAFAAARAMSRADDTALASVLDARQQRAQAERGLLGAQQGRVQLVDEGVFAGCLRREYRVRYAGGESHWLLKFRRSSGGGWALYGMDALGAPKT